MLIACVGWIHSSLAQPSTGADAFAAGARDLFVLNLAQEQLGEFKKSTDGTVSALTGAKLDVVEKAGQRMLRSSAESEFLITLPERLPQHFTVEFDLITRGGDYNSYELSFEGTPTPNKGVASAYVTWRQGGVTLFGGRDAPSNLNEMPSDVQAEIEGQLAEVRVDFAGDNFSIFTNGRRVYSAPNVKFPRARAFRVGLNGIDGEQSAMHLSKLRIADASTTLPVIAQQQSALLGGIRGSAGGTGSGGSTSSSSSGTGAVIAITNVKVSLGANGFATVTWDQLPMAATYFVVRWNANDPACCNAMSPPGVPLTSTTWQDGVLPLGGTYVYRVIGKTATGTFEGEGRFTYGGPPSPGVASPTDSGIIGATSVGPPLSERTPRLVTTTTTPTTTGGITYTPKGEPTLATTPPPGVKVPGATPPRVTDITPAVVGTVTPPKTGTDAAARGRGALPAPSDTPTLDSGGGGMVTSGRFQVVLTGVIVNRPTSDDPLNIDGRGDEIFGAAAVLVWDRQLKATKSNSIVVTQDYGQVGLTLALPNRIQAGSISTNGGLTTGDRAPYYYDPNGSQIPDATTDRFPLLVWEGELKKDGDMVIIVPSVWERDVAHVHWESYKRVWRNVSPSAVFESDAIKLQLGEQAWSLTRVPLSALVLAAPPTPTFDGQPINGYKIADLAFGPSNDRPIGMMMVPGVFTYEERFSVLTYEKVASMKAGDILPMEVPLKETPGLALNGDYTLYMRVKRLQ